MKKAIITGVNGQDGCYLSQLLLQKNYKVLGLIRTFSSDLSGLEYLKLTDQIELVECDLMNINQITEIIQQFGPDEIYNLAAQSSVNQSFYSPVDTFKFNTLSVFNLLEAVKSTNPSIRFYQASSSEMYGRVEQLPINENNVIHPLSPYAISKVAAHYTCINYREIHNMFICCGILFNHESYLRGNHFFIKKVIRESIEISKNKRTNLQVGNIDIKRDFGYAPKYVEAMYLMLQQEKPNDYIVCSGNSVSLREIIYYVFEKFNINKSFCVINKQYYRPTEIEDIYGTNLKAKKELNWDYNLNFFEVLDLLIEEEIKNYKA